MSETPPTPSRMRRVLVPLLSAALGSGATYILYETNLPDAFLDAIPIAEALTETTDEIWPPPPEPTSPDGADAGPLQDPLPPMPPPRPGLEARTGEADDLHYIEAVFGDADFDDPMPIVLVLHGRGGRALLPGGPFYGLSHPVRVIAPQAPEPLGSGYQWLPVRVGSGLVDRLSASLVAAASRLARFLRALQATHDHEGKAIVTGFSQGGLLTMALALYHDDVVGEALPLSAWLPPPLEPSYRREDITYPAIHSMHGTADDIIPIDPTRELFGRLGELSFEVELVEFDGVEHETTGAMNDLFHRWLEAAVCRAMKDTECAFEATNEARALQDLPPLDAGVPDAGPPDAGLLPEDAGADAEPPDAALPDAGTLPDAGGDGGKLERLPGATEADTEGSETEAEGPETEADTEAAAEEAPDDPGTEAPPSSAETTAREAGNAPSASPVTTRP